MTDLHPTMKPPRRFGPLKIIAIVLAGFAILGIALFFILKSALGPVTEAGDAYMGAMRDGNYAQVYALSAPSLQQELGSAGQISGQMGRYRPSTWSWSSRSVQNGYGRLAGSVTYQSGNNGTAELNLSKVDGQWRVTGFRLN